MARFPFGLLQLPAQQMLRSGLLAQDIIPAAENLVMQNQPRMLPQPARPLGRGAANRSGLSAAGAALLDASAPSLQPGGFMRGLAAALREGPAARDAELARQQQQMMFEQAQAREAGLAAVRQGFAGQPMTTRNLAEFAGGLAAAGDPSALGGAAQLIRAMKEGLEGQDLEFQYDSETGRVGALNPATGELVRVVGLRDNVDGEPVTLTGEDLKQVNTVIRETNSQLRDFQDQSAATGRFAGSVFQIRDAIRDGEPDRAAWAVHAMVMAFGKISDPGSVVREFEAAGIKDAGSLLQRADMFIEKLQTGQVTADMLESVAENVARQVLGGESVADEIVATGRQRLVDAGIPGRFLRIADPLGSRDIRRTLQGFMGGVMEPGPIAAANAGAGSGQ